MEVPATNAVITPETSATASARARHWVFTWNNPADGEAPNWNPAVMNYLVYQLEEGESGTRHYQGYVRFKKQFRLRQVKEHLGTQAVHLAIARGTEADNRAYCSKEPRLAPTVEKGEFQAAANTKGRRSDLEAIAADILQGKKLRDIAVEHPADFIRYSVGIAKFQQVALPTPPIARTTLAIWIYGATATGKTHRVNTKYSDPYHVSPGRDPFGHYVQQRVVVFDEFDLTKWSPQQMNKYCDKWRCQLDCRYQDKYAYWNLIIVISNAAPQWMFRNVEPSELRASLERRFQYPYGRIFRIRSREDDPPLPVDPETHWDEWEKTEDAILNEELEPWASEWVGEDDVDL